MFARGRWNEVADNDSMAAVVIVGVLLLQTVLVPTQLFAGGDEGEDFSDRIVYEDLSFFEVPKQGVPKAAVKPKIAIKKEKPTISEKTGSEKTESATVTVAVQKAPEPVETTEGPVRASLDLEEAKLLALEKQLLQQLGADTEKPQKEASVDKPVEVKAKETQPAKAVVPTKVIDRGAFGSEQDQVNQEAEELKELNTELEELKGTNIELKKLVAKLNREMEKMETQFKVELLKRDAAAMILKKKKAELAAPQAPAQEVTKNISLPKTREASEGAQIKLIPGTVIVDRAAIRVGPGEENPRLMVLSRGANVSVDYWRNGWYRVFTPNGVRAWIAEGEIELRTK